MVTSLGFHTLELGRTLTKREAREHYHLFKNHPELFIIPPKDENRNTSSKNRWLNTSPKYYNIEYRHTRGIRWVLKFDNKSSHTNGRNRFEEDRPCSIRAIINPKIITGIIDYVTAADESYLDKMITRFNEEARNISPSLRTFESYYLNRVDYCINFDLEELGIGCTPEKMMKLLKRANIPSTLDEWGEYKGNCHKRLSGKNLYLKNNSITVNCYGKGDELEEKYPNCPNIEAAKNVVRYEIQCGYPKIYAIAKSIRSDGNPHNAIRELLSNSVAEDVIRSYYKRTIGMNDYYTLEHARRIVANSNFQLKKCYRLIEALELVSSCRGISKAMDTLKEKELEDFKRSLRELADIRINPVTIPRDWKIEHIPNLLTRYYDTINDMKHEEGMRAFQEELINEYYEELYNRKNKGRR